MAIIAAVAILLTSSIGGLDASAATTKSASISSSSKFKYEWENTVTYKLRSTGATIGIMVYGFDKSYINEDYVWTKGYECDTKASIKRGTYDSSYTYSSYKKAGSYSKLEIAHKTYSVTYRITFRSTYGTITSSTKSNTTVHG